MSVSEDDLQQMSYRDLVELAKVNGVYQRKSSKKAILIKRLSSVWANGEFLEIENIDPNKSSFLPTLKELDETNISGSDCDDERRKTFTKVVRTSRKKKSSPAATKSTNPPIRQNTFTKDDEEIIPVTKKNSGPKSGRRSTFTVPPTDDEEIIPTTRKISPKSGRRSTFTVPPTDESNSPKVMSEATADQSKRRSTFTVKPTVEEEGIADTKKMKSPKPERLTRLSTSSATPKRKTSLDSSAKSSPKTRASLNISGETPKSTKKSRIVDAVPTQPEGPVRQGTFTKTPEKKSIDDIPTLVLKKDETPVSIEKLSVFQRLSSRISLSERRSLVLTEKAPSTQPSYMTPQSTKKAALNAIRDARKNHMTPKSLNQTITTSLKTPVQPIIKQAVSTTKKSSVKKPPNFAAIHKRSFAKMESLLENKKRLRERANCAFSPGRKDGVVPSSHSGKAGLAPSRAAGTKSNIPVLRMKFATKERLKAAFANKCTTGSLEKTRDKKDKKNQILKGVRMNKRFELQLNSIKQKSN